MRVIRILIGLVVIVVLTQCQNSYSPKPSGYLRVEYPQKQYQKLEGDYPYTFEYPVYGKAIKDVDRLAEAYWINIVFPEFAGKIHISYKNISGNLPSLIEDARNLAYKHTVKADGIEEILISYPQKHVHGILYDIKGNTASSVQFFLTDSVKRFLRGSLYFSTKPNKDSLAPVITFFRTDIDHLVETFEWKSK